MSGAEQCSIKGDEPMTVFCDQTSDAILKFIGVFPQGINRLHDAIDELNSESPFKESEQGKVELLSSKFSHQHGTYVVEVCIPYGVYNGKHGSEAKVPQSCMTKLFDAVGEFQSQEGGNVPPIPADKIKWVVNDLGELGVRIGDTSYFMYKRGSITYSETHQDGSPMMQRPVQEGEFGYVCRVPGFEIENDGNAGYFEGDGWFPLTKGSESVAA